MTIGLDSMGVLPVADNGIGSGALGAFAGALFGSWFGDGFGGRGGYGGYGAGAAPMVTQAVDTTALLQGQSNINSNVSRATTESFVGLNSAIGQGTLAAQQGFSSVNQTLCQGFSGVNASIYQSGVDTRFAVADVAREVANCCCSVKSAVAAEGSATRQLIQENFISDLQTKLCDSKAENAALKASLGFQKSQTEQTAAIVYAINNA